MGEAVMSTELFNDNGISYVAAAFFTGLFTLLGIIMKGIFDTRTKTLERLEEVSREATEARNSADKAQTNTQPISDGFVDRVDSRLERIDNRTGDVERRLAQVERKVDNHMNWHISQSGRKQR